MEKEKPSPRVNAEKLNEALAKKMKEVMAVIDKMPSSAFMELIKTRDEHSVAKSLVDQHCPVFHFDDDPHEIYVVPATNPWGAPQYTFIYPTEGDVALFGHVLEYDDDVKCKPGDGAIAVSIRISHEDDVKQAKEKMRAKVIAIRGLQNIFSEYVGEWHRDSTAKAANRLRSIAACLKQAEQLHKSGVLKLRAQLQHGGGEDLSPETVLKMPTNQAPASE